MKTILRRGAHRSRGHPASCPGAIWYRLGMGVEIGRHGHERGPRRATSGRRSCPSSSTSPLFGHGLQSVLWAPAMRMGEMIEVTHPHSAYLGALIDFGVVGAILAPRLLVHGLEGLPQARQGRASSSRTSRASSKAPPRRSWRSSPRASWASSLTPVPEQTFLWLADRDDVRRARSKRRSTRIARGAWEGDSDMCGITGYWARRGDPSRLARATSRPRSRA